MRGSTQECAAAWCRWALLAPCALLLAVAANLGYGGGQIGKLSAAAAATARQSKVGGWSLTSKAFRNNQRIPVKYTADGQNVSPDLNWTAPPSGTAELALICDDPDAPRGTWTHWVLYALPTARRSLPEAVPRSLTLPRLGGAKQGRTSSGGIGYEGPAPPKGPVHHYHFKLYALDAKVILPPGAQKADLERAMKAHVLAQAELVGLYSR
jgi:hypothetical protein